MTIELKQLVAAGFLAAGTVLSPRPGAWGDARAEVTDDGLLRIGDETFESPSGAAQRLRGGATNGWYFWRLPNGQTLRDVRASYLITPHS